MTAPRAAHRLVSSALVGAILGALLGGACLIFCPLPVGTPGAHSVALGRLCIFLLAVVLTAGVGTAGGLLSLASLKWRRPAVGILAFVFWAWLVFFTTEIAYRHVFGVRPTRSILVHFLGHLGPYLRQLSWSMLTGGAALFLVFIGVTLFLGDVSWKIALRLGALKIWSASALIGLVSLLAAIAISPPPTPFSIWVRRGTPVVAFGLDGWTVWTEFPLAPIAAGAPLGTPDAPPSSVPAKRPNVLLIVLESINSFSVGYGGASRPVTPNIDKLASASRRMRRAWSLAPFTSSAVSGLLSSTLPRRHRRYDLFSDTDYPRETIFSVLGREGFDTASIASDDQGSFGLRAFLAPVGAKLMLEAKDFPGEKFVSAEDRSADDREVVKRAIEWMSDRTEPWMLYVNLQRTHVPYRVPAGVPYPYQPADAPPSYVDPGDSLPKVKNRYDGALQFVDSQVGRLIDALDADHQAEDTLVVLVADHGEAFGEHGIFTHSRTVYESETRIPMLLRWPGHLEPADDETPVSLVDVVPTVLSLSGAPLPAAMQGSNMFDGHASDRAVFLEVEAIGSEDGVVCWPWKLIVDRAGDDARLFDLAADPLELKNLALIHPGVAASLRAVLEGMSSTQVDYYEKGETRLRYPPRIASCPAL